MNHPSKGATIAATAALMALSLSTNAAKNPPGSGGIAIASTDKVHCYGLNFCHGISSCLTTEHSINELKIINSGKKYKEITAKQCLDIGGIIGDLTSS